MVKEIIVQATSDNKLGYIHRTNRRVVLTGDIVIKQRGRGLFDVFGNHITAGTLAPTPRVSSGNVVILEKDGIVRVNGEQVEIPHDDPGGFSIRSSS